MSTIEVQMPPDVVVEVDLDPQHVVEVQAPAPVVVEVQSRSPIVVDVQTPSPVVVELMAPDGITASILNRLEALEAGTSTDYPQRTAYSPDCTYAYVGRVNDINGLETAPIWQIYRYEIASNTRLYADGDENYDNIWSDRESLTYS